MNAIRIRKKIESETLHLPELKPLIGKTVEITVLEAPPSAQTSVGSSYDALFALAGKDVVDPEAYKQLRAASKI
jgi:hypothetical protein